MIIRIKNFESPEIIPNYAVSCVLNLMRPETFWGRNITNIRIIVKFVQMESQGEIILYQPDKEVKLEVRLENDTVWLTQTQIVELFHTSKANISEHIKNIYEQGELDAEATVRDFRTVRMEGSRQVIRNLTYYNLDAIISIGFRVNTKRGIQFRQWANNILKDYLLKGYSINRRLIELEHTVAEHSKKIDFFVQTSLPPIEGIFYEGQIFDAYKFVMDLIRTASKSILLIDNYVDDSVLMMLSRRNNKIPAIIYTQRISPQLKLDIDKYNSQYPEIIIKTYKKSHDRFLIIDNTDVFHIGASLKDLGKKMFAFSKLDIPAEAITGLL